MDKTIDAKNLKCPMPIVEIAKAIKDLNKGELLTVLATDMAFEEDIKAWCRLTDNELVSVNKKDDVYTAIIKKEN